MTNNLIMDEAADWIATLRGGGDTPTAREQFAAWLSRSPEHVRAYLDLAGLWSELAGVDRGRSIDVQALVRRAMSAGNVVALGDSQLLEETAASRAREPSPSHTRDRRYRLAAAVLLAVSLALAGVFWQSYRYPTYTAAVGEQRSITLSDGSIVELNARSRVRVRFSPDERSIDLLEGQGLFRVAHNPARPFIVRSGEVQVRAVGTQFDVYRKPIGTVVTVLEGKVEVTGSAEAPTDSSLQGTPAIRAAATPHSRNSALHLAAGEQVTIGVEPAPAARAVNVEAATAWTQRQLVFDSAPLREVADEFNRYNRRQLVVADAGLEGVLINGVFSSTDPQSLLRFLRAQSDLEVLETDTEVRIVRRSR
ncbi:MAG TPA: FecR domain-containing protein [Steroidobacteraceae bacterium]